MLCRSVLASNLPTMTVRHGFYFELMPQEETANVYFVVLVIFEGICDRLWDIGQGR